MAGLCRDPGRGTDGLAAELGLVVEARAVGVAVARERPDLRAEAGEGARIREVPLDGLLDPRRLGVETRSSGGSSYEVPYIDVDGEKVWGATAMVLAELLSLIGHEVAAWG